MQADSASLPITPEAIERFSGTKILCIGDAMLDCFVHGAVERISPEAPIPVFSIKHENSMLGGAGNVVRNIVSLGAEVCFLSVVGDDAVGRELLGMVGKEERVEPYLVTEKGRISTKKTRYVAGNQQLLRADRETLQRINATSENKLISLLKDVVPSCKAIVLSDYGKGTLTPSLITQIIAVAAQHNLPVLVDPKGRDFSLYKDAFLISPNLGELAYATGMSVEDDDAIIAAARSLQQAHNIENVLVTRSKDGMSLVTKDAVHHIPARARDVFDVSGAGDTAIATLAVAVASGSSLPESAFIANIAAGIVVGKIGTAVIYRTDLKTALYTHDLLTSSSKIMPLHLAIEQVQLWQREGKRIGFTNGCFDLVHPGHLQLLQDAKKSCDRLIVALNSDSSVKRLKGESRPVNQEIERAMLLAALHMVDMVVIFPEDTPLALIEALRPDVLVKGADYTKEQVVGGSFVESYGGKIMLVPIKEGYSTTQLISRMA